MRVVFNLKPKAIAKRTEGQLNDPNITYNEAGITYNEAGLTYGGVYGYTASEKPVIVRAYDFQGISNMQTLYAGMPMGLLLALTYPTEQTVA